MPLAAEIVNVDALLSVIAASFVASTSLTLLFSLGILAATRAAELRRAGRTLGAALLGTAATASMLGCCALAVFGIYLIASN